MSEFIIVFREVLEASLVVGIVCKALTKTKPVACPPVTKPEKTEKTRPEKAKKPPKRVPRAL